MIAAARRVQPATRYGLVGIGALALLSLGHSLRAPSVPHPPALAWLLGVTPNFAAAIAITFILLGIWSDTRPGRLPAAGRRFLACATISGVGLLAWEVFQKTSRSLVYDPQDIGATLLGLAAAAVMFRAITPPAA